MGDVATEGGEEEEARGRCGYPGEEPPQAGATPGDHNAANEAIKAAKKAAASEAASKIAAARWEDRWESMFEKLLGHRNIKGDEWLGVVRETQDKASPPPLLLQPAHPLRDLRSRRARLTA